MELCEHLKPILDHELRIENKIKEISTGWTKVDYAVYLEKKMDIDFEKNNLQLTDYVRYWEFKGTPHNNPEKGFTCDNCKHAITGPL